MWTIIIISFCFLIAFSFWFFPVWGVWQSRKTGEAALEQANFEEQIAIAKANARLKSAEMNKQSEIVEAEAVSISINKIGEALQKNDSYLRWQWIKMMDRSDNATIYVPTEANLPILEASRLK